MNIEQMKARLGEMLRPRRLEHSLGVMDIAVELAQKWGADTQKAAIAGLLHDCAKQIDRQKSEAMIKAIEDKVDGIIISESGLWHAPLGAEVARDTFGIADYEIYDAIFYHTLGRVNMPLLTKLIYIADMIEPGRDLEYSWVPEIRALAFNDIDAATLQVIDKTLYSLLERGIQIHPNTITERNRLIIQKRNGG